LALKRDIRDLGDDAAFLSWCPSSVTKNHARAVISRPQLASIVGRRSAKPLLFVSGSLPTPVGGAASLLI
jgi:hypothetical protein